MSELTENIPQDSLDSEVTAITETIAAVRSDITDPIKDDGFCGYHCWSFFLCDRSNKNIRKRFLENPIVITAIRELYSKSIIKGHKNESLRDVEVLVQYEVLTDPERYPFTPLLRYLDLRNQQKVSAMSAKIASTNLVLKEKICKVLSPDSSLQDFDMPKSIPELVRYYFFNESEYFLPID